MTDTAKKQITEHEIREAELQMTGRPPATATGFIGFIPATPSADDRPKDAEGTGSAGAPAGKE